MLHTPKLSPGGPSLVGAWSGRHPLRHDTSPKVWLPVVRSCIAWCSPVRFNDAMKRFYLWLAAPLVALSPFAAIADEASDKAELMRLEKASGKALAGNDVATFEKVLAADWKIVTTAGTVMTRAELIETMKSGKLKFEHYEVDQLDIRVYGDTAVVIGRDKAQGSWEGEAFTLKERFTDIFLRKDGTWLCVSSHSTELSGE